jgi:galactonate dehydratase
MKITKVSTRVINAGLRNWILVKVETDTPGLYGWGEATLEWKTRSVVGAVEDLAPLIIGMDPRDHVQVTRTMHKWGFWKMGVIGMSAISGIEVALWDILGKDLGVPVWRLLGGKVRDKVQVYTHLGMGDSDSVYHSFKGEALAEKVSEVLLKGYKAVKIVNIPYTHYTASLAQIDGVARAMQVLREAVGNEIEIMVDFHGRCGSTSAALQYIEALAPGRPLFIEEPIGPGDTESLKVITEKSSVPIATGERLISINEFEEVFQRRAIHIAQPDLCHVGGFSAMRRIASAAEAAGIGVAPHNPLGPLAGVAALHFDIATPNFVIQEEMTGAVPWYTEILDHPLQMNQGYWSIPERPGLGVDINEKAAAKHPFQQETFITREARMMDGTVVDW